MQQLCDTSIYLRYGQEFQGVRSVTPAALLRQPARIRMAVRQFVKLRMGSSPTIPRNARIGSFPEIKSSLCFPSETAQRSPIAVADPAIF